METHDVQVALRRLGVAPQNPGAAMVAGLTGPGIRLLVALLATVLLGQWTEIPWGRWAAILVFSGFIEGGNMAMSAPWGSAWMWANSRPAIMAPGGSGHLSRALRLRLRREMAGQVGHSHHRRQRQRNGGERHLRLLGDGRDRRGQPLGNVQFVGRRRLGPVVTRFISDPVGRVSRPWCDLTMESPVSDCFQA